MSVTKVEALHAAVGVPRTKVHEALKLKTLTSSILYCWVVADLKRIESVVDDGIPEVMVAKVHPVAVGVYVNGVQLVASVLTSTVNTFVTAVNPSANTITISNVTTGAVSGTANLHSSGGTGTYSVNNSQTVPNTAVTVTNTGVLWTALTPAVSTINKINSIIATNVTAAVATITVSLNNSTGSANNTRLIYQLPVPVNASAVIIDKSTPFYLNENQSVVVTSGTSGAIEVTSEKSFLLIISRIFLSMLGIRPIFATKEG